VAVAKLEGVDTIGLAIPADELREIVAGRIGEINLDVRNSQTPQPDLRLKAQVLDPDGRVQAVKVLVARAEGVSALARLSDGSWPALPGASAVELKLDRFLATGDVKLSQGKPGAGPRKVLIQTAHLDRSGKLLYSRPRPYPLPGLRQGLRRHRSGPRPDHRPARAPAAAHLPGRGAVALPGQGQLRAAGARLHGRGGSMMRELLVEVVRGGREIDYYYIALPGDARAPLDLFLARRNARVTCMFSHNSQSLLAFREFALDYPAKVKIGLTASNLSRKPFAARFADFVLLDDKLKVEELFGE
jgi:hypothetical protein